MKLHASLLALVLAPALAAQCPIGTPGVQEAAPPIDGWSSTIPLGFTFPFNGTTYTDFYYSDHGVIALNNGGVPAAPGGAAQVWDPGSQPNTSGQNGGGFAGFLADTIMAYWGDHTVNAGGVFIDNTSGSHMTITWFDSEPYLFFAAGAFTAQMTLFDTGEIVVCLDDRCNNTSSTFGALTTVVGISVDGNPIPASSDFSAGPVATTDPTVYEEFLGPGPSTPNTPDPNFDLGGSTIRFIPTNPGWVVTVDPLVCATATTVGTGCAGLSLASSTTPVLGMSWDLDLTTPTPAPFPNFVAFGNETPPVPVGVLFPSLFSLTCEAYQDTSLGLLDIGPATGGIASASIAIPLNASLKGFTLTAQGLSLDIVNPAQFSLSNAETGLVGY